MKRIVPVGRAALRGSTDRPPPDWRRLFRGRDLELTRVVEAWERVVHTSQPEVVAVVGMSGAGKTRLVQEFYRWLADPSHGYNNGYWPEELGTSQKSLDIHPAFPAEHRVRAGSALPYLWFGIRYDNPDEPGSQPHPLLAAQDHLDPHLRYVRYAAELKKLGWETVKEDVSGILWSVGQGAIEMLPGGSVLTRGKEIVDRAGSIVGKAKEARRGKTRADLSQREFRAVALQEHAKSVLGDLEQVARAGKHARTPMVFVVDDAQWAGAGARDEPRFGDVLDFIGALIARARAEGLPILFLATHWLAEWKQEWSDPSRGDPLGSTREFVDLLRACGGAGWSEYGARIAAQLEEGVEPVDFHAGSPGVVLLPKIQSDALAGVLAHEHALPGVASDPVQKELMLRIADGNPRMLHELVLHLQSSTSHFERGDYGARLGPSGLEALEDLVPGDVQEVVQRRFQSLDDALKRILEYSAVQGIVFNENVTKALAAELAREQFLDEHDLEAWFGAAVTPLSFVAPESPGVSIHRFEHDMHFRVSRKSLGRARAEEARGLLAEILSDWIVDRRPEAWSDAEQAQVYELAVQALSDPDRLAERQLARLRLIGAMERRGAVWAWLHHGHPFLRELTDAFDFASLSDAEFEVACRGWDDLDHRGARVYSRWASRMGRDSLRERERSVADRCFRDLIDELMWPPRPDDAVAAAEAAIRFHGGDARWTAIDTSDWATVQKAAELDVALGKAMALDPSRSEEAYGVFDALTDHLDEAFERSDTVTMGALALNAAGMSGMGDALETLGEHAAAWAAFNGAAATGEALVELFEDDLTTQTKALERVLDQLEQIPLHERPEPVKDVYAKLAALYLQRREGGDEVYEEQADLERRMARAIHADGGVDAEAEAHLERAVEILEGVWDGEYWGEALGVALQDLGDWRAQRRGWEDARAFHERALQVIETSLKHHCVEYRGDDPGRPGLPPDLYDEDLAGAYGRYAALAERFGHADEAVRARALAERFRPRDDHPEDEGVVAIFEVRAFFEKGTDESLDRFLEECVVPNGLVFGGGYGDGWLNGMVEVHTGLATAEAKRRRVLEWLRSQDDVKGATAGLLLDGDTTEPLEGFVVDEDD